MTNKEFQQLRAAKEQFELIIPLLADGEEKEEMKKDLAEIRRLLLPYMLRLYGKKLVSVKGF